jgi:hypothetical protein
MNVAEGEVIRSTCEDFSSGLEGVLGLLVRTYLSLLASVHGTVSEHVLVLEIFRASL